jgi:hypothetical protein
VGIKDFHAQPLRKYRPVDDLRRFIGRSNKQVLPHKGVSSSLLVFMSGLDFQELLPVSDLLTTEEKALTHFASGALFRIPKSVASQKAG